jgi:hypothetical protein
LAAFVQVGSQKSDSGSGGLTDRKRTDRSLARDEGELVVGGLSRRNETQRSAAKTIANAMERPAARAGFRSKLLTMSIINLERAE